MGEINREVESDKEPRKPEIMHNDQNLLDKQDKCCLSQHENICLKLVSRFPLTLQSKEHWLEETITVSDLNESGIQMMRFLVHDFCKLTVKLQEECHDKQFSGILECTSTIGKHTKQDDQKIYMYKESAEILPLCIFDSVITSYDIKHFGVTKCNTIFIEENP